MATLPTKTFLQIVQGQVAAIQGATKVLIDFTIGSILRAVVEATAQTTLWLQALILQLLTVTRLGTSTGADVDSWGADFNLPRLGPAPASTQETFGRFSTKLQGIVPLGSTVELTDGSAQYAVTADPSNPAYNAGLGGFVLAPGVSTINALVVATTPGSGSNAAIGAINTVTSAIPGVDYCTNAAPVDNGVDAETDAAYRLRFVAWINSLSRAVLAAITLAVDSVQLNASCFIMENMTYAGAPQPGFFAVIVNDGTGNPPASFISACQTAIESVRGLCIDYGVFPPVIVPATVALQIDVDDGADPTATQTAVVNAISAYFGGLGLGESMQWTRLAQLAYDAAPGDVDDVSNIQLNGGAVDLNVAPQQLIQLSSITVVVT